MKDELFEAAAKLVIEHRLGSTSLLQRRLMISFSRANGIMEQLEAEGIVGEFNRLAPRQVLVESYIPIAYQSNIMKEALEENGKHICPYTESPCQSLACSVRNNGICNIFEVMKHEGGQPFSYEK